MEVRAISKSIRISPRKVRLVADAIRNLSVDQAMYLLLTSQKRAARPIAKTLKSAVANALNNAQLDQNNLVIASIMVNEGQALKRFHPSTRGRIHPYKKRSSHITIVVKEKVVKAPVQVVDQKKADEPKKIEAKKDDKKKNDTKKKDDKKGEK